MTATTIVFIDAPLYSVDFRQYSRQREDSKSSNSSRVRHATALPFLLLKELYSAVTAAGYETLSYTGTSFKHIVLSYTDDWRYWQLPANLPLVILKIVLWVAALNLCFLATTARLLYERTQNAKDTQSFLCRYADPQIDVSHIVTRDLRIDASAVPAHVKVSSLIEIFNQINFADDKSPGYMSPKSRVESRLEYSVEDLKEGIKTFVSNVNGRVAFLGTPPLFDTPRLFAFYEHIENAVRFAIHKSDQAIESFKANEGDNVEVYSENTLKVWKNLLEDRARIALNLAIAGKHCGARYMGEATELYLELTHQNSDNQGSLQQILQEILASQRVEIATAQIQRYLGTDTHGFASYMSALGKTLALPGMSSVVEHLSAQLDKDRYLKLFFQNYSVDRIIAAVQNAVKKSQPLREKIIDWIKDQRGDWHPDGVNLIDEQFVMGEAALAKDELDDTFVPYKDLLVLKNAISHLIQLPPSADADPQDLIDRVFLTDKEYWKRNNPDTKIRMTLVDRIKKLFSDSNIGQKLREKTQIALKLRQELDLDPFTPSLILLQKSAKICRDLHLANAVALRVARAELDLREALETSHRLSAESEFLSGLKLDTIIEKGLSQELTEWLLVSQKILLTQARGA